jgi:hypothetical protein
VLIYHNGSFYAKSSQETGALESDVRGSDEKGLARMMWQGKDIIRSNTELLGAGNIRITRAAAGSQQNMFGCDNRFFLPSISCLKYIWSAKGTTKHVNHVI